MMTNEQMSYLDDSDSTNLSARLKSLGTSLLCDALMQAGYMPNVIDGLVSRGASRSFAGQARTVQQARKRPNVPLTKNLTRQSAMIDDHANAGEVVVIAAGGYGEGANLGGLNLMRAEVKGIEAILVDGSVRDVEELENGKLPVFARSVHPASSKGYQETVSLDEPVTCGGALIRKGDWIVGDRSGILVIDPELVEDVCRRAEEIRRAEQVWEEALRRGLRLADARKLEPGVD